ncbi:putative fluoride ion transporter CrcB 2 [Nocardioides baekrokdamisoli]|uniref:Fluoride-specific ion channel FluC n=1 Tax=Nocardioides baekrokdamisoli TaxID=1804624 RepID=A0A3G9IDY4_9ACTN|nr:fluoride efflux transporter CrcB [Nocardioides baekrokdamisoli]BBH17180.1 putative fluoride ion transporter CrcB 2 [Nocardioides baekrokdamisoli]
MIVLAVLVGGAIGSTLRYLTDLIVQSRHASRMPWGTFAVNVTGSFVLGMAAASWASNSTAYALWGTGFCGGLTTFSTFSLETVRLSESGAVRIAVLNVVLSLAVGLAAVSLGWWLVRL